MIKFCLKTTLTFLFLIMPTVMYGQKRSKIASQQICECVELKLQHAEQQHYRDSVYRCFGEVLAVHLRELKEEFKIKDMNTTVESVREVRDRLLIILEKRCRYFARR